MNEAQWSVCPHPDVMLDHVSQRLSGRKIRLFGVACCRRIQYLMTEPLCRQGVDVSERFAEGAADDRERSEIEAALEVLCHTRSGGELSPAVQAAYRCTHRVAYHSAVWSAYWASKIRFPAPRREQAELLRHIAGNPFQPVPWSSLPVPVIQLAEAMADGADAGFALHDALLEVGRDDLADHFRTPQEHPRGCHVIDVILGKK